MKKLLISSTAALGLIGAPAFAADMAVKAPPAPPPVPVFSWTGWYAGVNAGASFGRAKTDFNMDPITVTTATLGPSAVIPGFGQSDTSEPSGFIGGGQIGYNWQVSPIWVVGLEADFQGSLEKDSVTSTRPFDVFFAKSIGSVAPLVPVATATGTSVTNYTTKIDWVGTVRARLGYVWGDGAVLTYVTGGLAYGKVGFDATSTVSGTASPCGLGSCPFSISHAISHSQVNTGWTVGFGTEGKLLIPGWTYKIETLYVDLGSDPETDETIGSLNASGGLITGHVRFTDAIVRLGVNYQFH